MPKFACSFSALTMKGKRGGGLKINRTEQSFVLFKLMGDAMICER